MKKILIKNRVMVAAILSAITLTLQQALKTGETEWKAIGFAILIAVCGVIGNRLSGQGFSIAGIVATLAGVFHTIMTTGSFTWNEFILSSLVAITTMALGTVAETKEGSSQAPKFPYNASRQ